MFASFADLDAEDSLLPEGIRLVEKGGKAFANFCPSLIATER